MDSVHFTSAKTGTGSDVWTTPRWLFDLLDREFGPFTLDAAADESNKLCGFHFGQDIGVDALIQPWRGIVWCNPPYSGLAAWLKKGHDAVHVDKTAQRVVMLVPARTDTKAFQAYAPHATVFFLKGRLRFGARTARRILSQRPTEVWCKNSAPFPSAVLVFDREFKPSVHFVDLKAER